jgi:hypothetical protein
MAIFRGIGGAGDSTTDATVTAVTEQAINAANSATAAASSASSASSSASAASASALAASGSEASAAASAASETAAAASESAAATSASNASTSASNASSSASAAASSASAASTSESNAASSASAASLSASSVGTSETNAGLSASAAATSETNAGVSEGNAATSASSAATSESNAATSASNAAASEGNAASSTSAAATSESNAASSESAAATSQANAAASELAAASSETAAAASETAAATSETNAATSESNAATSASNAATSESNAATSASNAATSESNAATSESNAATSASDASSSASAASASETAAAASESAVATSASNAATSASNAATSESNAATSASTATTQAGIASSAATTATTQASNASSSASSAASSASSASASADAALAALDSFDDRYLGQKASDPSVDNDGNALVAGALYFNTTDDVMKVYEGSTWVAAYASLSGALLASNNLSDLSDVASARTNLGLAASATTDTTNASNISSGTLSTNRLDNSGVTAGTYGSGSAVPNITVDAKGIVTSVTTSSLVIPTYGTATATATGMVKLASNTDQTVAANTVTATSGRTYGVQLNTSDQMVVNVPWSDTNTVYTLPEATSNVRGGLELFSDIDQSVAANAITTIASRTYGLQLNSAGQGVVNVPWTDTNTTYGIATDTVAGLVELFNNTDQTVAANTVTTVANRTYGIQLNAANQAVVNVPWTDTTYTLPEATSTTRGGIELFSNTDQSVAANAVTATASRTYGLQLNSAGQGVVNVPWTDTNTTYGIATSTTAGLVEVFNDTDQSVAANAVTATAGRTYGIQLNSANQAVVNVPWTDTNTTYTASKGVSLFGTDFRITGNEIPGSINLNTYRTTGFYTQNANADAASGSNYPVATAGILQVINDDYGNGLFTTQLYSQYASTNYYYRTYHNGTWQSWRNLAQDTNTVYTHPSYAGDDINLDTGALTGATVISDLDFNVTTDTLGHVTDANATYSTRSLTAADVGAAPAAHNHDRIYLTDSRGSARAPSYYDDRYAQWDFQNTTDTGAGGDEWHGLLTVSKWTVYDASHRQEQLAFTGNDLKRRTASSDGAWGAWKVLLDSTNYTTYAPTKTGTGASGTWGINITGNAATATTLQTARTINGVSFNGSANIVVEPYISDDDTGDTNCPIIFSATTTTGYKRLYEDSALYFDNTSNILYSTTFSGALSGNAATATKLTTARNINGTSFNGTANITTANWGTARTLTIGSTGKSVNGSGNVSWSLSEMGVSPYKVKAWVNFNGIGTVSIRSSGNVSSITDNGVGDYTVNFTTAMPNASYAATAMTGRAVANNDCGALFDYTGTNITTTSCRFIVVAPTAYWVKIDGNPVCFMVIGD